jgi:predicted glutamine amidotransferase
MCRFLAYLGEPILLEDLVCKPRHSLVRQSLRAVDAKTVTNGDGFGIGWYGERESPGVHYEVMPAWSDENLLALCANVRSRLFFVHVRAATGGGIARQNCHPFHYGPCMFIHNGQIGGYAQVRRAMEHLLPDALYEHRRGATDSELLFLLIVAQMQDGVPAIEAVRTVLRQTHMLMQSKGIDAPLRFAAALTDGEQAWAFRWSSDETPPTLYLKPQVGGCAVASESLGDDAEAWTLIGPSQMVHLHTGTQRTYALD